MALKKMIGIVGGVGSYAGIDLIKKIYDQTDALCDQDHLPVSMLSVPDKIWDRTDFLLGNSDKAKEELGWEPNTSLEELIKEMIINDKEEAKKESLLKKSGFTINSSQE